MEKIVLLVFLLILIGVLVITKSLLKRSEQKRKRIVSDEALILPKKTETDEIDLPPILEIGEEITSPAPSEESDGLKVFHRGAWQIGQFRRIFKNGSVEVDVGNGPMRKKMKYIGLYF